MALCDQFTFCWVQVPVPEGQGTQYLRFLVPKTILLMVFGTRDLKHWVLGPSGCMLYKFLSLGHQSDLAEDFPPQHEMV